MSRGEIQMLMVRGADPVYGLPGAVGFKNALYDVPYIVSFSDTWDDTTAIADLVLPQHNYLEDWGSDVPDPAPGYQVVGFQQPVVRPFFEARGEQLGNAQFRGCAACDRTGHRTRPRTDGRDIPRHTARRRDATLAIRQRDR